MKKFILISKCLLGYPVRYDASSKRVENLILTDWEQQNVLIAVCPEMLGGLCCPRKPAEIQTSQNKAIIFEKTRILNTDKVDVSTAYYLGAKKTLQICQKFGITIALLKEKSPSCGVNFRYDGSFSRKIISGSGVTTSLLKKNGIFVFSENQIEEAFNF